MTQNHNTHSAASCKSDLRSTKAASVERLSSLRATSFSGVEATVASRARELVKARAPITGLAAARRAVIRGLFLGFVA